MRSIFGIFALSLMLIANLNMVAQKKHKSDKSQDKKTTEETSSLTINDACQREKSLERIKGDMSPFRFDKVNTTRITYKSYDKVTTVAIPLFHTTQYRFIINAEGMPTGVEFKITDKPLQASTAKVLFQSSDKHFVYETPKEFEGTRIYVSIKVPADSEYNNGVRNKGCVIMGSGYQNLDF